MKKYFFIILATLALSQSASAEVNIPLPGGEEVHCYNGHEGPNCYKRTSEKGKAEQKLKEQKANETFELETRCGGDADCALQGQSNCVLKNSTLAKNLGELSESGGRCRCLNGPVVFGCVPQKQYDLLSKAQKENR